MSLVAPLGLLGLAFLPLIIAFWMLKLRRTERVVSSTILWRRFGEDREANMPWQKLRRSLLLLLQLLLVVVLALLAARPFQERPAGLAQDVVVVLDASASMAATDVAPSRLEAAKGQVLARLGDLPAGGRVSLVEAGAVARVVVNATTDVGRIRSAIAGIHAAPAVADLAGALRLASGLASRAEDAQVIVATDAAFTPPADLQVAAPVTVLPVGRDRHNVAIVALAVRASPTSVTRSVFTSVVNVDLQIAHVRLEILGDGHLLEARELTIDPITRADVGIDDVPADVRTIEVRIVGGDQLAFDDRAWAIVPEVRDLSVLLVSEGDPYLETALQLMPGVQPWEVGSAGLAKALTERSYDVVIFDAVLPATLPRIPTLAIAPPRTSALGTVTGSLTNPALGHSSPDEPLLRYVDLTTLHVAEAQRLVLPDWARTVIPSAASDPLLYSGEREGIRTAVLAFEPRRSDLPLQVAFPVLFSNLIGELAGASQAPETALPPGSLVTLQVAAGATGIRVTRPDGSAVELAPAVPGGTAVTFGGTDQLGIYMVEPIGIAATPSPGASGTPGASPTPARSPGAPGSPGASSGAAVSASPAPGAAGPTRFAVDLFDVGESTITPGDPARLVALGGSRGAASPGASPGSSAGASPAASPASAAGGAVAADRAPAREEIWPLIALAALVLLFVELLVSERDALVRLRRAVVGRLRRGPRPAGPSAQPRRGT